MLAASLILNVGLALALTVIVHRARKRIIEEKLATFAGCIGALASGLAREDADQRNDAIGEALAKITGQASPATVTFLLVRASLFRILRMPNLADLGEHLRLLALEASPRSDGKGDRLTDYIAEPDRDDAGAMIQPRQKFGDEFLGSAQFEAESQLLDFYRARISALPLKLFG